MARFIASAASIAVAFLCTGVAQADTVRYSSAWFFGDSLSDPGNLYRATDETQPPSPPYYDGRFSNGPVWAEAVAQKFSEKGLPEHNFAFGGATALENDDGIPDLPDQITAFAAGGNTLGDRPLAALWFGANDIFNAIKAEPTAQNVATAAAGAAFAIGAGIESLVRDGVDDFLVFNMVPLELTPQFALLNPLAAPLAQLGAATFNAALASQIDGIGNGVHINLFDTHAAFIELFDDPERFGVSDVTNPCILPDVSVCTPEEAEERAFYDPVHPNDRIHAAIAGRVLAEVAPVPLPAPLLLLFAGFTGLAAVGRRRA